jgi:serine/threonine protein kinase
MVTIVDTALDVARALVHLHSEAIIHSDLKARNILLKSSGGADGRPFVAKVRCGWAGVCVWGGGAGWRSWRVSFVGLLLRASPQRHSWTRPW